MRTQKRQYKENGDLDYFVDYIWEDGKLVYQYLTLAVYITRNGVTTMHKLGPITSKVIYDDSGVPQGFMVNDASQYAFVRNLQGDVIAMIDQNGETVMEYSYDPWGNIEYHLSDESLTEEDAALITALCPLTYRGYNYDFTTGLYYLQSRYYNPEWGRFLNCDDTNILLTTQGETHNANLFAYCGNNPINNIDPTGFKRKKYSDGELLLFALIALETVQIMEKINGKSYMDKDIIAFDYVIEKHGLIISKIAYETGRDSKYEKYQVSEVVYGLLSDWKSFSAKEKEVYTSESQYNIWVAQNNFGKAEIDAWHDFNLKDGDPNEFFYRSTNIAITSLFYGYPILDAYFNGKKWKPYTLSLTEGNNKKADGMGFLYKPVYTSKKNLNSRMKLKKREKVPSYSDVIGHTFF